MTTPAPRTSQGAFFLTISFMVPAREFFCPLGLARIGDTCVSDSLSARFTAIEIFAAAWVTYLRHASID
jgi:hypothetical protein